MINETLQVKHVFVPLVFVRFTFYIYNYPVSPSPITFVLINLEIEVSNKDQLKHQRSDEGSKYHRTDTKPKHTEVERQIY